MAKQDNTAKKVALVTGGVGGIGSAICAELASKGFKVIAGYHPAEEKTAQDRLKEWKQDGVDADIASGDVSSFASCADSAKKILEKHGRVDVLVNCAGITRDKTLRKMNQEEWQAVLDVDLNSLFNVTKQFIDGMSDRGWGRVINISSIVGEVGNFGQANYAAAKAGVIGLTKTLAREYARKGVTVNAIAPGFIRTRMLQDVPEKALEAVINMTPVGRLGEPSEIAAGVAFLASPAASYITGHVLDINGGMAMGG